MRQHSSGCCDNSTEMPTGEASSRPDPGGSLPLSYFLKHPPLFTSPSQHVSALAQSEVASLHLLLASPKGLDTHESCTLSFAVSYQGIVGVCFVCFGVCVCVGQGLVLGIFSSSIAVHRISTGLELANLARQVGQESPGAWITGTKCHA